MGQALDLAVQSYCFRGFKDNRDVIEKVKESGLDSIEVCAVHADFSDTAACDEIIQLYADNGVKIVSTGVNRITGDKEKDRNLFEFCKKAGTAFMSIDFNAGAMPGCFRVAEELADEYGLKLGIHNHGGKHWLGSCQMLDYVFSQTGPQIGLCLDTAWALDSRENPVAMAERYSERLYGIHYKDFIFDRARTPEDVIVGTGNLDLPALVKVARDKGFSGYSVLEYEGDVDNPVPAVSECVNVLKQALA